MYALARPAIRERLVAYGTLLALCGAVLLPLLGVQRRDSFPISTYPMFAGHRGQPTFHRLVAVLEDGSVTTLPPERVASSEVLQTKVIITRAVRQGKKAMMRLCRRVAKNVALDPELAQATELRLEEVRFDAIRYFTEGREPIASKVLARCDVARGTP